MPRPKETKYCETDLIGKRLKARYGNIGTQKSIREAFSWIGSVSSGTRRPNEASALLDDLQKHLDAGDKEFFLALADLSEKCKLQPAPRGRLIKVNSKPHDPLRHALLEACFSWGSEQTWKPTFGELVRELNKSKIQFDALQLRRICCELNICLSKGASGRPKKQ